MSDDTLTFSGLTLSIWSLNRSKSHIGSRLLGTQSQSEDQSKPERSRVGLKREKVI